MEDQDNNTDYDNVVDKLLETFGEILSRDVILAIVESYEGNLDESANAIMNITMDGNCMPSTTRGNGLTPNNINSFPPTNQYFYQPGVSQPLIGQFYPQNGFYPPMSNSPPVKQPAMSYSAAYHQMPRPLMNPPLRPILKSENMKPPQHISRSNHQKEFSNSITQQKLNVIYKNHDYGCRTLIILRGAPGSGKSFLAQKIVDTMYNKHKSSHLIHIFSTDQYFMRKGVYEYCRNKISDAHEWNQRRALDAMMQGISPVIIDNTNTEIWEMKPYVESGVRYGYIIEVLEPDTTWAKKPQVLFKKNTHNVPFANIQKMLENFQPNITGEYLLHYYGFKYGPGMAPPVLRTLPPYDCRRPEERSSTNFKPKYLLNDSVQNVVTNNFNPNLGEQPQKFNLPMQNNVAYIDTTKAGQVGNTLANSLHPIGAAKNNKQENASVSSLLLTDPIKNYNLAAKTSVQIDREEDKKENTSEKSLVQTYQIADKVEEVSETLLHDQGEEDKQEKEERCILLDVAAAKFTPNEIENNISKQNAKEFTPINDFQKTLEDYEKVEIEWESGEQWEEAAAKNTKEDKSVCQAAKSLDAKPPRINKNKALMSERTDNALKDDLKEDWTKLCMFLPSWSDENKGNNLSDVKPSTPVVEKTSNYTCIEIGDTNINSIQNPYKIVSTVPRDINEFHLPITNNKIPDQWMLHKSTSTHDNQILSLSKRCKNEEQHFKMFEKFFKNVDTDVLRDIFDKCCGDINWAVDIVLDDMASGNMSDVMNNINTPIQDIDVPILDCNCLSAYNIIPERLEAALPENETAVQKDIQSSVNFKKPKRETAISDASIELKRQIEENIVIPDNHYSQHCLKIRKIRRGEIETEDDMKTEDYVNTEPSTSAQTIIPEHQNTINFDNNLPSTSKMWPDLTETSDSASCGGLDDDDVEKTVNVTIGKEFVTKLDEIYGGSTTECLDVINPTINIPMSLLNEINALWVESVTHQLQENSKQYNLMVAEDEELARQLAVKEDELYQAGKEPEVPDFKEIMDMDYALSVYQKDVAEWRNNLPDDLAAKLTREKLCNLFPSISSDVLSELLLAHENNFQLTVEVLLASTGQTDILNTENGVNKFVAKKEMERQEKLLQEEKKALSEEEWPFLPKGEKVDMALVQKYRDEADKHLRYRNMNYTKAQMNLRRGMTHVAIYYSDIANFHKMKFEQANSMAAACLMQMHSANTTDSFTIDLHYMRVGEAKEALDLFIDKHIKRWRQLQESGRKFSLYFITGRGLHSQGQPKIKPAMKRRLLERGLSFTERNPGLLAAKVCAEDKLSYQIA